MPQWLVVSIVLSIVLTILVNAFLWLFPGAGRALSNAVGRLVEHADQRASQAGGDSRVRVIVPWKLMLIGSIALTVAVNLLLVLAR